MKTKPPRPVKIWGLCPNGDRWFVAEQKDNQVFIMADGLENAEKLARTQRWERGVVSIRMLSIEETLKNELEDIS